MTRFALSLSIGLAMLFAAVASHATVYQAVLSGPNENPPTASGGSGVATIDVNTSTHLLHVTATFSGLSGVTTASHIHCCITVPGGTAGVATTTPTFPGFPLNVNNGTYDNTLDMSFASAWNPAFITANGGTPAGAEAALVSGLANGLAYFNIHTSQYPGGEIRGFLLPVTAGVSGVPTLSEWAVPALGAALGLAFLVSLRRRLH